MDRRVKERLVGASILVVLIVLIVPELLSGPAPVPATSRLPVRLPASAPEPRNVIVDLGNGKAQATAPASDSVAGPAASAPSPVATVPSPAASAPNPVASAPSPAATVPPAGPAESSTGEPATAPAALENAPARPTSLATAGKPAKSGHSWAVQLGSFASRENADKLAHQLKAQGFAVYISPSGSGASSRYRVRVGPMADHGAATQTVAKLKSAGHVATLVPPAP
jgi:DedD protein